MITRERIPLSTLTTLRVGGDARFVIECASVSDVREAISFARSSELPWRVLGGGSNVLASDSGYEGVILLITIPGITTADEGAYVHMTAGAGVSWDDLVKEASRKGLWGIENLAGIPGTVGAAPVQNIGAYGTETKDTLVSVEVYDSERNEVRTLTNTECAFEYRESRFKHDRSLVIVSVTFRLQKEGVPSVAYKDLAHAAEQGVDLSTPHAIAEAVRTIRSRKFPDITVEGTAGSFFKNPTVSEETFAKLKATYPELPGFPNADGIKIPLAFVLDKVLMLRGYTVGPVSLFREQPLVLVASNGATEKDIDTFANEIALRVFEVTGISIEREVQSLP